GVLTLAQAASSKDKVTAEPPIKAQAAQPTSTEHSKALGDEARRNEEARRRAWDEKTKAITRGICSGC
ncbi:MAG: hypothetical protein ABWY78_22470, partial [Microvirga sp.]